MSSARDVGVKDLTGVNVRIDFVWENEQLVAKKRATLNGSRRIRDKEFGRVDEDDPLAVLPGAILKEGIVAGGSEHPSGGAKEEVCTVATNGGNKLRFASIGTDEHADTSAGGCEAGGGVAGGVTDEFVLESVLAIFSDE